ncbi:hypothetical protein BDZ90DRAFT_212038, partial [Jaminaea rosea]
VLQKSMEYLETFSRYKELDTVRQLRKWEGGLALTGFERAQLANLAVETVEEAKNLIPTLETKDEVKLQALIDELATLRKFQ